MKKIPDNATRVFEGLIFDVYQWQQKMFDDTESTFEALYRKPSVTVIAVTPDGNILYNNEEQPGKTPFSSLPGGRVEEGDTALFTAKKELREETGYESEDWVEWFTSDASDMSKLEWESHYFIAKNCQKKQDSDPESGEKIETVLITFEELLDKRKGMTNRSKSLEEKLERVATDNTEAQTLKTLLGIE